MKGRRFTLTRFTLTLSLATIVLVAVFVALPLIAEQECTIDDEWEKNCSDVQIFGYGKVEKPDNVVKAKAQCRANQVIEMGWYWIHAQVLPHSNDPDYNSQLSDNFSGSLHKTVNAKRPGQPKSNGYAYVSIWGSDDEDYYSVLIDLPD